ncbi:MAG: hypothetical protein IT463_06695 [Planctomycetes bacterium]|nr:hypothetical protein [Planctomycetota bacterium]
MTEPLSEARWDELNGKLLAEQADAEQRVERQESAFRRAITVMLLAGGGGLAVVFTHNVSAQPVAAGAAVVLLLAAAFACYVAIRRNREAGWAKKDVERVAHDLRQWKKRKPGK